VSLILWKIDVGRSIWIGTFSIFYSPFIRTGLRYVTHSRRYVQLRKNFETNLTNYGKMMTKHVNPQRTGRRTTKCCLNTKEEAVTSRKTPPHPIPTHRHRRHRPEWTILRYRNAWIATSNVSLSIRIRLLPSTNSFNV
jgi:hypothetical protein